MVGEQQTISPGTRSLLIETVIDRTKAQLDQNARKYSSAESAEKLVNTLVATIEEDHWKPDVVISWIDEAGHWNGGKVVGERLAGLLGIPALTVVVEEHSEARRVKQTPELPDQALHVLLAVDSVISGRTHDIVRSALAATYPGVEFRTAALTVDGAATGKVEYRGTVHRGKDMLFPWGWARTTFRYYDILNDLNVRDRRWMPQDMDGPTRVTRIISDEDRASVTLLTAAVPGDRHVVARENHKDELLYVVSGTVDIEIREVTGSFATQESIFIPYVVPYDITLGESATLLIISFEPPVAQSIPQQPSSA
jgi:hypoxanthine phosphoribosyltransferase